MINSKYRDSAWATAGHFATDFYFNFIPALLPVVAARLGLSLAQVGFITMTSLIASNFFQPVLGLRFDKHPSRSWLWLSLVASGLFMCLSSLPVGYAAFTMLIAIGGFANGAFHPIGSMVVYQADEENRGLGMSIYSTAGSLGYAIAPAIAAAMIVRWGTPSLMWWTLALPLLGYSVFQTDMKRLKSGPEETPVSLKTLFSAGLLFLTGITILRAWGHLAYASYLVFFLEERGYSYASGANLLTVFLIAASVGGLIGGKLSDSMGRKWVVISTMVGSTLFSALFILTSGWLAIFCLIGCGFMVGGSFPVLIVLGQELMPNNIGFASGISMGFSWGIAGLGIYCNGIIGDMYGLNTSFWLTTAILGSAALLTVIAVAFIPRKERTVEG